MKTKIGYLGPKGSYTWFAVLKIVEYLEKKYPEKIGETNFVAFNTISQAVKALERSEVNYTVVPWENICGGEVTETSDSLAEMPKPLKIVLGAIMPISHVLAVKPENADAPITHLISHSQGFAQCSKFIRTLGNIQRYEVASTAQAAREVKNGKKGWAAICSELAAKQSGLLILKTEICDYPDNRTLFITLGKEELPRDVNLPIRSSVIFTTLNQPGALVRVLQIFDKQRINLSKINSRPFKANGNLPDFKSYLFFVDLDGDKNNLAIQQGWSQIDDFIQFKRFFGSYNVIEI
jgi:prephenate dehydratase